MSFPPTRPTLIQRLAAQGEESAWQEFMADYWGPVCRFALHRGSLKREDAEDVAAQTFAALLESQLLARWMTQRTAKLRTLLCAVTRNVLANRARVQAGRARLLREHGGRLDSRQGLPLLPSMDAPAEEVDALYAAWVAELLQRAVGSLLEHYHQTGKGDYFRALYGRLCEGLTMPQVAEALGLTISQAENAYKDARKRLSQALEDLVRDHVCRYCPPEEAAAEFTVEWGQLGEHLKKHGGLEEVVRRAAAEGEV